MRLLDAYIPIDRRQALLIGCDLPSRTSGAILCADISGFTPLTEVLARELGPRRGADVLSVELNRAYGALVDGVHLYEGSVIGFSGDAITCWFENDAGPRATACALTLQQIVNQLSESDRHSPHVPRLSIKVAVTTGPARRFTVGDPVIQIIDALAGATVERVNRAEKQAARGEVVFAGSRSSAWLYDLFNVTSQRGDTAMGNIAMGDITIVKGFREKGATPSLTSPFSEPNPLPESLVRPWILPQVWEKLKAGSGQFLAELRPTAALFLSFGGPAYDENDDAGDKLDAYVRWVQRVLAHHGGHLIQLTCGDKHNYLYATFGALLAHDDDATRAIASAIALRAPPKELNFVTHLGIGISWGLTWTGAYGGPKRRTYGVLGDEVNVAARLMGRAKPGQILLSEHAAEAISKDYALEPVGSLTLKGKRDAVSTYALTDRQPVAQKPQLFAYSLVGRDQELELLKQMLETVVTGKGRVLRLEGTAGIGKSHLATTFVAQALERGYQVAMGTCQSISQDTPHHPWRQVLCTLFGIADDTLGDEEAAASVARRIAHVEAIIAETNPDWLVRLPLLGDLLNLPIPDNETTMSFAPPLRRESLLTLTVQIMRTWAQSQPLLVLIEDAHWMDEASRETTIALSRAIDDVPLLLVLVHRPADHVEQKLLSKLERLPYHSHLLLHEPPPWALATLLTDRLHGRLTPLAQSLIVTLAQGNPFLAKELTSALRESGDLYRRQNGIWDLSERLSRILREAGCLARRGENWTVAEDAPLSDVALGIPESVHGVVLSRVDRLPETHKMTLKVASVIGHDFDLDLLANAYPAQIDRRTLRDHLAELEKGDFIQLVTREPSPAYTFKHNITQEVTYRALLEDQRRELHRAVGQALEVADSTAIERLAHHYTYSGVVSKSMLYLDRAARKAQREFANETARRYYDQALAQENRWQWLQGKANVLHILGQRDEEQATLHTLERADGAPIADTAYLWGQFYEAIGEYAQAQTYSEQALRAFQENGDPVGEANCLTQLGRITARQGDYGKAQTWYQLALELFQGKDACAGDEAHTLNGLGVTYGMQGDYRKARKQLKRALSLSRASGNPLEEAQALNNLGILAFYERDFAEAVARHQQALEIRRTIGDRSGEGASLLNLAQATRDAGEYDRAHLYLSKALAILQAIGDRWVEGSAWNDMGVLHLLTGDLQAAQTCLQRGLALSKEIKDQSGEAYVLCNLGQVLRDAGDLASAERALADGLALAEAQNDRHLLSLCLSHLANISLLAGLPDQAKTQATQALEMRREMNLMLWATADLATLARAHLALGDTATALDYARQALSILHECGGQGPEYPQHDYFTCYQVLAAAQKRDKAREALQSAYDLLEAQANRISDEDLRRSFLEQVPQNRAIVEAYQDEIGCRHPR
jgi:class 3 adenylate cyclase/predicted ATPase